MLHRAANRHPKATHQWLLLGRLNNPLAHLAASKLPKATSRKHFPGMLRPPLRLPGIWTWKLHALGKYVFLRKGFVWRFCLSRLLLRFPRSNPSRSQPAGRKATSRKHFPGMLRPPVKTSRHLDMKITCFGQVSFTPEGFVWRFCLSSPKQPFPHSCSSSSNHWPRLQLKTLKTLKTVTWHEQAPQGHTSMASYGPLQQSLGMLHPAANRHPKATHQWLLMGVQACRLPALKPLKPSKPSKRSKPSKPLKTLKRWLGMLHPAANSHPEATHQWLLLGRLKHSLGMLHPAANGHPKATHQWLLMGVQACRLPALKPLKPSKPSKRSKPSKPLKTLKRWLGMLHPAANSHPEATHQWLLLAA